MIIQSKESNIEILEKLNETLVSTKMTEENLKNHKLLIHSLVNIINTKREEIFIMNSKVEIMEKELNFWIYGFEKIKANKRLRDDIKKIQVEKLRKNLEEELKHKSVPEEEKLMLINSDRFLISSNQRSYFYDQKAYYLQETARLQSLYEKAYYKKREYKKNFKTLKESHEDIIRKFEREIMYLKQKLYSDKKDIGIQTDIDCTQYLLMQRNHELVTYQHKLQQNSLEEYVSSIKYGISHPKPISYQSLLTMIAELYNEKIEYDIKHEMEDFKITFDEYFILYMKEKFKLKKIIKSNCENFIAALLKYCQEDKRIDLARRFLGIGDDRIRPQLLDIYFVLLKSLPASIYKLFSEDYNSFLINTQMCFEIYYNKLPSYYIIENNLEELITLSEYQEGESFIHLGHLKKIEHFYLTRFFNKSTLFFSDLYDEFVKNPKNETILKITKVADLFIVANKEFEIDYRKSLEIFKNNFIFINENHLDFENFLDFFKPKRKFSIKISNFIEISFDFVIHVYRTIENQLKIFCLNSKEIANNYLVYKDFEEVLLNLIPNFENRWKINDYFKRASGSAYKEFISKEELIIFILNNKDLLKHLLLQFKRGL